MLQLPPGQGILRFGSPFPFGGFQRISEVSVASHLFSMCFLALLCVFFDARSSLKKMEVHGIGQYGRRAIEDTTDRNNAR